MLQRGVVGFPVSDWADEFDYVTNHVQSSCQLKKCALHDFKNRISRSYRVSQYLHAGAENFLLASSALYSIEIIRLTV